MREISARFGFDVDPDALVEDLPVGVQQRVEIIKALSRDAKVLVFDEPTAVLTPQETDELMEIMRQLKASGASIVFITHKLREVREVADRITVIRLGKVVGEASPTASNAELASMMVGRAVELTVHKDPPQLNDRALVVENLSVIDRDRPHRRQRRQLRRARRRDPRDRRRAGQRPDRADRGAARPAAAACAAPSTLDGEELVGRSVRRILDEGVGFVPEDRTEDGLVGAFTIAENLMLDRSNGEPFVQGAGTSSARHARRVRQGEVHASSTSARRASTRPVGTLSGGNQQKVVLARELSRELSLFVAAQPTRGVDVGSIEFIHKRIVETRDAGVPVVVVSTELDEVTALADRIMVMYRGRIVGIVPGDTPRDVLGLMMAGEAPRRSEGAAAMSADRPRRTRRSAPPPSKWHTTFLKITQGNAIISVLAVVLALIVGGILIAVTDEDVQAAAGYFFARPGRHVRRDLGRRLGRLHRAVPGRRSTTSARRPSPARSGRSPRRSPSRRRSSRPDSASRWRSASACSTSAVAARC